MGGGISLHPGPAGVPLSQVCEETEAVVKLGDVTDFGPEVSGEPLERPVLGQRVVQQLQNHEPHAGRHGQTQVPPRPPVPPIPLEAQPRAHCQNYVAAQRHLKAQRMDQRQAVAEEGAQLEGRGIMRVPGAALTDHITPHWHLVEEGAQERMLNIRIREYWWWWWWGFQMRGNVSLERKITKVAMICTDSSGLLL